MQKIGLRLQRIRKQNGVSQEELAKKLHVQRQTISSYERGVSTPDIYIQDNYINQGASAYACNGIYLTSSRDSLIQRNVLENIGTCGIELYFTDNVAVQYNEVSNVDKKGGGADDNAIDPDWRSTNALIQYNYIHDCGEGLLLCGVQYNSGRM